MKPKRLRSKQLVWREKEGEKPARFMIAPFVVDILARIQKLPNFWKKLSGRIRLAQVNERI